MASLLDELKMELKKYKEEAQEGKGSFGFIFQFLEMEICNYEKQQEKTAKQEDWDKEEAILNEQGFGGRQESAILRVFCLGSLLEHPSQLASGLSHPVEVVKRGEIASRVKESRIFPPKLAKLPFPKAVGVAVRNGSLKEALNWKRKCRRKIRSESFG